VSLPPASASPSLPCSPWSCSYPMQPSPCCRSSNRSRSCERSASCSIKTAIGRAPPTRSSTPRSRWGGTSPCQTSRWSRRSRVWRRCWCEPTSCEHRHVAVAQREHRCRWCQHIDHAVIGSLDGVGPSGEFEGDEGLGEHEAWPLIGTNHDRPDGKRG